MFHPIAVSVMVLVEENNPIVLFSVELFFRGLELYLFFFFFKDTAPPEIYPLPLHDALPISASRPPWPSRPGSSARRPPCPPRPASATTARRPRSRAAARPAPRRWPRPAGPPTDPRSEEHTSELQSPCNLVCRLLLEKKKRPV